MDSPAWITTTRTRSHEEIARSLARSSPAGVTRFYPTVITGAPDDMAAALRNLAARQRILPEGRGDGRVSRRGPAYLARRTVRAAPIRGAGSARPIWTNSAAGRTRPAAASASSRSRRNGPGAALYRDASPREGVVASIGHTKAGRARRSPTRCRAGATLSTHLGNGAHQVLRRHPNYIWDQLAEDRLMADFIVDGIHLDAAFLKVALRAKGIGPLRAGDGRRHAGGRRARTLPPGRAGRGSDGGWPRGAGRTDRLAGSALRMDRGVDNLMRLCGLPLADAVRMATVNAAKAGAVPGRGRGLEPGDRADFVQFRLAPSRGDWNALSGRKVSRFFLAQALEPAASRPL